MQSLHDVRLPCINLWRERQWPLQALPDDRLLVSLSSLPQCYYLPVGIHECLIELLLRLSIVTYHPNRLQVEVLGDGGVPEPSALLMAVSWTLHAVGVV